MAGVDCARGTLRGGGGGVAGVDVGAGVLGIVSFFLLEELMLALGDCDPLGVANLASRQTRLLKINTIGKFLRKCHRHKGSVECITLKEQNLKSLWGSCQVAWK